MRVNASAEEFEALVDTANTELLGVKGELLFVKQETAHKLNIANGAL